MLGELGQLALCFALALSLVMAVAGLIGAGSASNAGWRAASLRPPPWA